MIVKYYIIVSTPAINITVMFMFPRILSEQLTVWFVREKCVLGLVDADHTHSAHTHTNTYTNTHSLFCLESIVQCNKCDVLVRHWEVSLRIWGDSEVKPRCLWCQLGWGIQIWEETCCECLKNALIIIIVTSLIDKWARYKVVPLEAGRRSRK